MKPTRVLTIAQRGPSDQRINGSDWRVFTKLDQGDWGQRFSFHAARRVSGTHVSRRPASEWAPHVGCADSPEAIADRWIRSTVQIEARPSKLSRTEPLLLQSCVTRSIRAECIFSFHRIRICHVSIEYCSESKSDTWLFTMRAPALDHAPFPAVASLFRRANPVCRSYVQPICSPNDVLPRGIWKSFSESDADTWHAL